MKQTKYKDSHSNTHTMITRTIAFSTKIVTKNDLTTNLITLTRYSYFNVTFLLLLRKITNYHISTAIITV